MLINISDILTKPYTTIDETVNLKMNQCELGFGTFTIQHLDPVRVTMEHLKDKEYNVTIETRLTLSLHCDRCLKVVNHRFNIHGYRYINLEYSEAELTDEFDQANFIDRSSLDVEQLILSELVLNWPTKVLCDEECKGLCNVCGKAKSSESCGCEDTSLDPRMSVVHDLFKNAKG
jgi:uncharacterized protein